jgi:type VI secretion system protein ImpM
MSLNNSAVPDASSNPGNTLIAGWYGKIPFLGDFISRRLPASFINVWDVWMQQAMAASRAQLGDRWLDLYLTGPIWRFALMPGIFPGTSEMWAGVLMPSVDKVGRYFPLTIAVRIEPRPGALPAVFSAQSWYASMERIALAMLNTDAPPDDLDRNLAENLFSLPEPGGECSKAQELAAWWRAGDGVSRTFTLPPEHSLADLFDTVAQDLLANAASGRSFWWTVPSGTGPAQLRCFAGLPPEECFANMLEDISPNNNSAGSPLRLPVVTSKS